MAVKVISELKKTHPSPKLVISAKTFHHNKNSEYISKIYAMIHELGLGENVIIIQDEFDSSESDNFEVVKDLYKICDVVISLSSYENFGLPILEAGITKTPIICNKLEVFNEISANNIYFTNVSRPPSEIAQYISEVLKQQKTANLFQEIKKKYSLESVFEKQILPLIDKIMKQN